MAVATLLDVDFTLSPAPAYPQRESEVFSSSYNGSHFLSAELRQALQALPGDHYWCTSWEEEAEDTFSMGWQTLFGAENGDYWWKGERVLRFLQETTYERILWLDDELPELLQLEDFSSFIRSGRLLPLAPTQGLTPVLLARGAAYLRGE